MIHCWIINICLYWTFDAPCKQDFTTGRVIVMKIPLKIKKESFNLLLSLNGNSTFLEDLSFHYKLAGIYEFPGGLQNAPESCKCDVNTKPIWSHKPHIVNGFSTQWPTDKNGTQGTPSRWTLSACARAGRPYYINVMYLLLAFWSQNLLSVTWTFWNGHARIVLCPCHHGT